MAKVTLINPVAWPLPHGIMRHVGTVLDVSDEERGVLEEMGVVAPVDENPAPVDENPAPVDEDPAPVDEAPAPVDEEDDTSRPKQTAPLNAWRDYAEAVGVDHKGLTKQEIIAATK